MGSLPLKCTAVFGRARILLSPSFCSSAYMTFIVIIISAFVILPSVGAARAACFIAWNKAVVSNPLSDHYLPLMLLKSQGRFILPWPPLLSFSSCEPPAGRRAERRDRPSPVPIAQRLPQGRRFASGEARLVENELNRAQCLRGQMEPEVPVRISALRAWQIGCSGPAWGDPPLPFPSPSPCNPMGFGSCAQWVSTEPCSHLQRCPPGSV